LRINIIEKGKKLFHLKSIVFPKTLEVMGNGKYL